MAELKVITVANNEVGYLEKKTKNNLDSKTTNAGSNNYTKYWADMAPSYQGQPWCACFVNWCFKHAYGEAEAKNLLCTKGAWSYYTPTSAQYFKNKGQWYKDPIPGDVIFFKNSTRICHTGLVYKVDGNKVYTIEGNTSGGSTLVANGGGVAKKSYALNYGRIAGYGRPNYSLMKETPSNVEDKPAVSAYKPSAEAQKTFIKEIQAALGLPITGKADSTTFLATITVSAKVNNKHAVVKPIQKYFNAIGFNCGTVDGEAGSKFDKATRAYQKEVVGSLKPDGEITAVNKTWKSLLGFKE